MKNRNFKKSPASLKSLLFPFGNQQDAFAGVETRHNQNFLKIIDL